MILKKLLAIMTAAVLAVCAAGCGKNTEKAPKHYMAADYELDDPAQLDDWQINVLKSKGLPTDYNELKIGQRDSIYRMGMMHRYLVDKYGIEFEYAGYYQSGFGQKEELIVMPEGAYENDSRSIVSVREKDGEFSDNYGDYEVLMYIENMYEEHAKEFFKSDKIKAIAVSVNDNQLGYSHFDEEENFHNDLGISAVVIISDEICDREKCEEYADDLRKYLGERELVGITRISVLKNVDVSKINNNNLKDYRNDNYIIDLDLGRDSDGKTDILYLHEDKHIYYDEKGNIIDK
ncbi:hypothetical protein [Ruminococcus albus]|uniref:Lipoprotein n=1 Tax=Ruminococcus albus (strain ATCC 27210 / DSM 20455 / JCM 14654 / NCDO 2250 / 7) TaxID=697329 RepID=E6UFB6_RUMA7|nr:hypothetical protein [Ruminococcus albus]ADU21002.1 hypothetical protein Rumal_0449 [Ruminococcus albus 7 = DSM 20455]